MTGLTIVCATRETEGNFFKSSSLGKTLSSTYQGYDLKKRIFFGNTKGLSECYNIGLSEAQADDILVFTHDDIFIPDFFWLKNIFLSLKDFHLIGLAGNRRRIPKQPGWAFTHFDEKNKNYQWDERKNLSGIVGHGNSFPCSLSIYGQPEQRCLLLDGVFLAARKKTFLENKIRFDEQFKFHFYDMDICRQFENAGLSMGTAPVSIIHNSGGNFGSPEWITSYKAYLEKWGE